MNKKKLKKMRRLEEEMERIEAEKERIYQRYLRKQKGKRNKRNRRAHRIIELEKKFNECKNNEKYVENPRFSLIASAIRKETYYKAYWDLRVNNETSFEMIFAGDCPPDEFISKNFKYLDVSYPVVKCTELAARTSNSTGQTSMPG